MNQLRQLLSIVVGVAFIIGDLIILALVVAWVWPDELLSTPLGSLTIGMILRAIGAAAIGVIGLIITIVLCAAAAASKDDTPRSERQKLGYD